MLKSTLAIFLSAGIAAWAQAPKDSAKVDRATAYYHYTLANLYAHMADAAKSHDREYREFEDKAIDNYKAALKADPQTPPLRRAVPLPILGPVHRLRPPRQDRSLP
jgi:hypothetical protein